MFWVVKCAADDELQIGRVVSFLTKTHESTMEVAVRSETEPRWKGSILKFAANDSRFLSFMVPAHILFLLHHGFFPEVVVPVPVFSSVQFSSFISIDDGRLFSAVIDNHEDYNLMMYYMECEEDHFIDYKEDHFTDSKVDHFTDSKEDYSDFTITIFVRSPLTLISAAYSHEIGMLCVVFYSNMFISTTFGRHIKLRQTSVVIQANVRDDQQIANYV